MASFKTTITFSLFILLSSCFGQLKTQENNSAPTVVKSFKTTGLAPDFDTTLVSQYIRSIFQDSKGNLWFGTIGDGVVRYDKKNLQYFSTQEGFISNSVFAINEDHQGNMWFGTDQGVYQYNGKTFRNFNQKDGLQHIDISRRSILVDKSGKIWVGTHRGVYQYDAEADQQGKPSFSVFSLLPEINTADIFEDKSGNIWFATSNQGVFKYDGKTITNFNEKAQLGENYAGGIAQDPAGNMWFVFKNGICKYDGKTFTEYTAKDGLGGTEFWGILIEKSGIIWITARGSNTRYNPSISLPNPKAFSVFTSANGFTCCVQSMFQDKSGKVWWGTGQGLYNFDQTRFYQVKRSGPWQN